MGDSPQLSSDRAHPHGVTLHAPHAPHLIVCYRRTVCLLLMHILPVTAHDRHRISDNIFTESGLDRFTVRCGFRVGPNYGRSRAVGRVGCWRRNARLTRRGRESVPARPFRGYHRCRPTRGRPSKHLNRPTDPYSRCAASPRATRSGTPMGESLRSCGGSVGIL